MELTKILVLRCLVKQAPDVVKYFAEELCGANALQKLLTLILKKMPAFLPTAHLKI